MVNEEHSLTPRQQNFLKRLTGAKDRLMAAIDGLAPEVLCDQPVLGSWTVKDLLGHIKLEAFSITLLEDRYYGKAL